MLTPQQKQQLMIVKQMNIEFLEDSEKHLKTLSDVQINGTYKFVKINIQRIKTEIKIVESILSNQLKQFKVCLNVLKIIMAEDLECAEEMTQCENLNEMDYINIGKVCMGSIQVYEKFGKIQFNLTPSH
jgi:hypothetical protein